MAQAPARTLLEDAVEAFFPMGKRSNVRKLVLEIVSKVITLLTELAEKRAYLVPVLKVIQNLLLPSTTQHEEKQPKRLVIARIKLLKQRLAKANEVEQKKISLKLEGLYELLIEDGDE